MNSEAAEAVLRYVALPLLTLTLGALITLFLWLIKTQGRMGVTLSRLDESVKNMAKEISGLAKLMEIEAQARALLLERIGQQDVKIAILEQAVDRRQQEKRP